MAGQVVNLDVPFPDGLTPENLMDRRGCDMDRPALVQY
jgi:hypothetical protein